MEDPERVPDNPIAGTYIIALAEIKMIVVQCRCSIEGGIFQRLSRDLDHPNHLPEPPGSDADSIVVHVYSGVDSVIQEQPSRSADITHTKSRFEEQYPPHVTVYGGIVCESLSVVIKPNSVLNQTCDYYLSFQ